jgi:hypothetical protein
LYGCVIPAVIHRVLLFLLFYRSIEELQEQNQKLLSVVRELSDAQEQKEMETGDGKSVNLNTNSLIVL